MFESSEKAKAVLLHSDQRGEPDLYIRSTAWAGLAVLIEPVSAKGFFHCFLDHPFPKALLQELFPFSCGWQVFVSEVAQFLCVAHSEKVAAILTWGVNLSRFIQFQLFTNTASMKCYSYLSSKFYKAHSFEKLRSTTVKSGRLTYVTYLQFSLITVMTICISKKASQLCV